MEKKKLKLLGQNKPMTPQVPKSAVLKPPTVSSASTSALPLSSPKQQSKIKPNVPVAVQLQDTQAKVPKQCGDSENDQKMPSANSTQNDCIKVDALKEMHGKDACKDNDATDDTGGIDCEPVETASMQKVRIDCLLF